MTSATGRFPLTPGDAVAAIILTPDQRFVMQRRDPLPHIWYPGAWGLFGGGMDPGETERQALLREIKEELDIEIVDATWFTRFQFDFSFAGGGAMSRAFFEVQLDAVQVSQMRLLEGAALGIMHADEVLDLADVVGYDRFALDLYIHRQRIVGRRQIPATDR